MNIEEILEMMDDMLDKAVAIPLSGKRSLIDIDKMSDLINEIKYNMPTEIKQARNLVNDRKVIVSDAKDEADAIIRKAEERARLLVSNEEIVKQAQAKANDLISTAQTRSKEIRFATNEYVDGVLSKLEESLARDLVDVKKTRNALKSGK